MRRRPSAATVMKNIPKRRKKMVKQSKMKLYCCIVLLLYWGLNG